MTTIKDIAKLANISPAAVSRVLNGDSKLKISQEKRILIKQIAEDLNYVNPRAKQSTKYKIAIITPYTSSEEISDPFYLVVKSGIEEKCKLENIEFTIIYEHDIIKLTTDTYEGALIIGNTEPHITQTVKSLIKNIIFLDHESEDQEYTSITINFEKSVKEVLNYCQSRNIKSIGMFAGYDSQNDEDIRTTLFKRLAPTMFDFRQEWLLTGEFTLASGLEMAQNLIDKKVELPECIFCANDSIAIGAIKGFTLAGIKIPEQISIIGFNNIEFARYSTPSLTTVSVPTKGMGIIAVEKLINTIEHNELCATNILLNTQLKIRKSVK